MNNKPGIQFKALLLGLLFISTVHACPPGTIAQQGIGWQGCAPVPGTSGSYSSTSGATAVWANRWGAVAIDMTLGGAGISSSSGMDKRKTAERLALAACRRKGGTQCKIEISYYNQCAVIALGSKAFSSSSAASLEEAKRLGLEKCSQSGDINCEVHFSECSFPERVR